MGVTNFTSIISTQSSGSADVDKITAAFDKLSGSIDSANERSKKLSEHPGFDQFASKVKQGLSDPLGAAGSAMEGLLQKMGPQGAALAGGAAIFTAIAVAGYDAAKSLGEYATQIQNVSIRTGLTTREVGQFSFAAKVAGQDVSVFESGMRMLSQGLEDSSAKGEKTRKGLSDLGVTAYDSSGKLKPMSDVFLQISEGLVRIEDPAKRDAEALKVFGRAGIELLPTMMGLAENVKRARELGLGPTEEEIKKWEGYHRQIAEVDSLWEQLKRNVKEPLAAVVIFTLKTLTDSSVQNSAQGQQWSWVTPQGTTGGDPLRNSLLNNPGLYAPGADQAGMLGRVGLFDAMRNQSSAKGLEGFLGQGLEGAQAKLANLKTAYDDARSEAERLAKTGSLLPAIAAEQKDEVEKAYQAYKRQSDIVKELEKDESKRISNLEKMRDLVRQGLGYYLIGSGATASILPSDQLNAANPQPRGLPSLFGRGQTSPYASTDMVLAQEKAQADYKQGLQVIDGQMTFVAPTSARGPQIGGESVEQLDARTKAAAEKRKQDQQIAISGLTAEAEATTRIMELRAGPGGELATAKTAAAIRQDALEKELAITGDIAKYREESDRNQLEFQVKVAELERKRIDDMRNLAGGLFDSLFQGSKGIEQFFVNIMKDQGRKIFENIAAEALGGKSLNLGLPGKIFQGTMLGKDPLQSATTANTLATVDNTNALRQMAMSASGGGGSAGGWGTAARNAGGGIFTSGGNDSSSDDGQWDGGADGGYQYGPENYDKNGNYVGSAGGSSLGKGIAYGGAAAAGIFGAYSGFKAGGAQGALQGTGSILGAASLIPGPQQPFIMAAAMATTLVAGILGDPKKNRQTDLETEAGSRQFSMPSGDTYSQDLYGRGVDTNYLGQTRTFITNHYNISTFDPQNLQEYLIRNPGPLAAGLANAVNSGNADDAVAAIRSA